MHGQDEHSGRNYLMLEGTDAKVHFIHYTPEMEEARNRGGLRTNSFLSFRKLFVDRHPTLEIDDLGNSESLLKNRRYFEQTTQRLIKRGIIPTEDGWGGWLGRIRLNSLRPLSKTSSGAKKNLLVRTNDRKTLRTDGEKVRSVKILRPT